MRCIHNGIIHTAVDPQPFTGDILMDGGKIVAIGPDLKRDDAEIIDASGLNVYPGFVEAHCHIGLDVYAAGVAGADFNEKGDPLTPQLSAIDGIDPFDRHLKMAVEGGVTCICTGPGSSNVIGGTFTAIKPYGIRVDEMVVTPAVGMKCAFGENPKRFYPSKISSRMTIAAMMRDILYRTKLYIEKKEKGQDVYDQKLEALVPVLRGELPLKAHVHQANDIFTAIRIAKEFGVKMQLDHVTEGHLIVDELAKEKDKFMMAVGPSGCSSSKYEFKNVSWDTAAVLANAGCHVCIITDSPVVPEQNLPIFAGFAMKAGLKEYDALRAITINAAEHVGIQDRVGSLELGKDADVVLVEGNPFELSGRVRQVFINGNRIV